MLDSEAQLNIIKASVVPKNVEMETKVKVILKGITEEPVTTLGALIMVIHGQTAIFHVAPNEINVPFDGILGSPFFYAGKCNIDYGKRVVVICGKEVPFHIENEEVGPQTDVSSSDCYSLNVKKVNFDSDLDIISSGASSVAGSDDEENLQSGVEVNFVDNLFQEDTEITLQHLLRHQGNLFPDSLEIDEDYNYSGEEKYKDYINVKTIHSLWAIEKVGEDENYTYLKDFQESIENDPDGEGQIYFYGSEDEDVEQNFEENMSRSDKLKTLLRLDHLNEEERAHIDSLIEEYADLFYLEGDELGGTDDYLHQIQLTHDQPITLKQYRIPYNLRGEVGRLVRNMLSRGIIEPSESPYQGPVLMVP